MELAEATLLVQCDELRSGQPLRWADLGCGDGLFTRALAHLLNEGSLIYAVDKKRHSIDVPEQNMVDLDFVQADFEKDALPFSSVDGILMANSLHFVRGKKSFVERLKTYLKKGGMLIVVEYEMTISNPWIPFPVNYEELRELFFEAGFKTIKKLNERKSRYGTRMMYSCLIQ